MLFGIIIFESFEHPKKALSPIEETLSGIIIFSIKSQLLNAKSLIFVILFGMIIVLTSCSINVLLFNILIVSGSLIPFNIVSPNKTFLPIISTISGIIIFVSDEQSGPSLLKIFCYNFIII